MDVKVAAIYKQAFGKIGATTVQKLHGHSCIKVHTALLPWLAHYKFLVL